MIKVLLLMIASFGTAHAQGCFDVYQAQRMTMRLDRCTGATWVLGGSPLRWNQLAAPRFQPINEPKFARFQVVLLAVGSPFLLLDTATGDNWQLRMTTTFAEWAQIEDKPASEIRLSQ